MVTTTKNAKWQFKFEITRIKGALGLGLKIKLNHKLFALSATLTPKKMVVQIGCE